MNLIIVESPTKAHTLSRFLGSGYQIEATYGHIRDLPKSKIGVDVDHGFSVDYEINAKQKKRVSQLKKAHQKAHQTYLATDPDREGEAIAWHVAALLRQGGKAEESKSLRRVSFHEITETAIKEAIENPREIDAQLVDAQQARRVLDRLVGYKLSPLLWRKVRIGLSAGRVQSVAARLVVDREREIEAFKAEEYWEIFTELKTQNAKGKTETQKFKTKLIEENDKKIEIKNNEEATRIENELKYAQYQVASVEKKEFRRTPPPPFTTSTLQQTAANRLGWSAKKTMLSAQRLYEEGRITYHRTDSTNIAAEAAMAAKEFIAKEYAEAYALAKPRFFKTKSKVAQEAHEAIRPTNIGVLAASVDGHDEVKLYELIWKRFVACQMAEVTGESTKVKVVAGDYALEAKGERIKFLGWYKILDREEEESLLPELNEGEKLELIQLIKEQKYTQPPARYNDASLIKVMEELGIGRPSTYAPTLSTILERRYVEKEDKRYRPTNLGLAVNDFLVSHFPNVVDYGFTATMENSLDEIARGEKKWQPVIADFYTPFAKDLENTQETAERVKIKVENTGEVCPKCEEGEQVIRSGKYGKFLACSRFPDCDWKDKYLVKIGVACPKCGGDVLLKRSRRGRPFYGCSRYPHCAFASWTKPLAATSA